MPLCRVRKVIVFGASTGGIQTLGTILKGLPLDLDAALLAVIHTSDKSEFLPQVLSRWSPFEVIAPAEAQPVAARRLYVAGPNRHLVVKSHCVLSWLGPRENRHRPAVDVLFRSTARLYRSHVIAVVLSGALDDGTAGALAVKARGGTVLVQDPADAMVPDMPANVLRQVKTRLCLPAAEIPNALIKLVAKGASFRSPQPSRKQCQNLSEDIFHDFEPFGYTCPECGGVVMPVKKGRTVRFRCHVGHAFSLGTFSEAHADALERALWVALRKLNEQKHLQESLARNARAGDSLKRRHQENAAAAGHDMKLLHEILFHL